MNDDSPSMSVNFSSPGKLPDSSVILCLAGPFALGYVVWYREAWAAWTWHLALPSLGFLIWNTDTIVTALHSQGGKRVKSEKAHLCVAGPVLGT